MTAFADRTVVTIAVSIPGCQRFTASEIPHGPFLCSPSSSAPSSALRYQLENKVVHDFKINLKSTESQVITDLVSDWLQSAGLMSHPTFSRYEIGLYFTSAKEAICAPFSAVL